MEALSAHKSILPGPFDGPLTPASQKTSETPEIACEAEKLALEEMEKFKRAYAWLTTNFPEKFLCEFTKEHLTSVVHNLIHFNTSGDYAHIVFPTEAVVLCLNNADADRVILERYSKKHIIINFWAKNSLAPLPGFDVPLRITHIEFGSWARQARDRAQMSQPQKETGETKYKTLAKEIKPKISDQSVSEDDIIAVLREMNDRFINSVSVERVSVALDLFFKAQKSDLCQYTLIRRDDWQTTGGPSCQLVVAWRNLSKLHFLHKVARVLKRYNLIMRRANCTYVRPYTDNSVFLMRVGLHGVDGQTPAWEAADLEALMREMVLLKFFRFFDGITDKLIEPGLISGTQGTFLRSLVPLLHQTLLDVDPNLYTTEKTSEAFTRHPEITAKLCTAFELKFHPTNRDLAKYDAVCKEVKDQLKSLDTGFVVNDTRRRNVLAQALNVIQHTLKTNFYSVEKMAVSFRLDPAYLDHTPFDRAQKYPELPYSVFYVKGMHSFGFHVRFRDLARGGLRTVTPGWREKADAERENVFTEVYNLAYTQHKKNKDIPESGAKCIIFLAPYEDLVDEVDLQRADFQDYGMSSEEIEKSIKEFRNQATRDYLYSSQRAFVTALVDILNCDDAGKLKNPTIVDYYGKPEYIYLGPDENMHDIMIEWIANYSKSVGYKPAGSFITGRMGVGFNHKFYGVTSHGVFVYAVNALKHMGIDPQTQPFTVKITGGPDGDVGGNIIRNLQKHVPHTAKLVVITDGTGTINDPNGLNLDILCEMFHKQQGIKFYPPEKMGPGSFLLDMTSTRQVSSYTLETLCWKKDAEGTLHETWLSGSATNQLFRTNAHATKTDIFIPCGGRPKTLNDSNWKDYLDSEGKPTSRAIVEGANLYLTAGARQKLEELGCIVIKDSSANKCGVITSSYEVLCGLALTEAQFLEEKEALITDVLDILRQRAESEAKVLLDAKKKTPSVSLVQVSDLLSEKIILYTDQFLELFSSMALPTDPSDPLVRMYMNYAPKTLATKFTDALLHRVPEAHKRAVLASSLACHLVYSNGIDWTPSVVDLLPVLMKQIKQAQDQGTL